MSYTKRGKILILKNMPQQSCNTHNNNLYMVRDTELMINVYF